MEKTKGPRLARFPSAIERLEARIAPASLLVTNLRNAGAGSLRNAIDAANELPGEDVITFQPSLAGTIRLGADLPDITDSLRIAGLGSARLGISGGGRFQIFDIVGGDLDVTISGLSLTGGLAESGGAIHIANAEGDVLVRNCRIVGNRALGVAGNEEIREGGDGLGGGIAVEAGKLTLVNSLVSGNRAHGGRGLYVFSEYTDQYTGETTRYLSATYAGGSGAGGGIYAAAGAEVTVERSRIVGNIAEGGRGDGSSARGGGISNAGTLTADRVTISGNMVRGSVEAAGGGLFDAGSASLVRSRIMGNAAGGNSALGGGIDVTENASLTLESSVVSGNLAFGFGGAKGADGLAGAHGANGSRGDNGASGETGENGESGEDGESGGYGDDGAAGGRAQGGGLHNLGSVTIQKSTISGNRALGGNGGDGGKGGDGGAGGRGGNGGNGGPAYRYDGTLYDGGFGGSGGDGGSGADGGNGGNGGGGGEGRGGGIFSGTDATLTLQSSTISGNLARGGLAGKAGAAGLGGAAAAGGFKGISRNSGDDGGGGDYYGGYGSSTGSAVIINTSGSATLQPDGYGYGGGYEPFNGSRGERGSPGERGVAGEAGAGAGGGIYSGAATLDLSQVTISGNRVVGSGGGLHVAGNVATRIHNSTIAGNFASDTGGGLFVLLNEAGDSVDAISAIIAGNLARTDADVSGTINASFSLIQVVGDATINGADNILAANPRLGVLRFNGGPVATILPGRDSPAIDHGSNPDELTTDARGRPRLLGSGIDIGAVEAR